MFSLFAPGWFCGYDVVLELVFAIIALAVFSIAYRIYRASDGREVGLFSLGFFLIGLSFISQAALNAIVLLKADAAVCAAVGVLNVNLLRDIGIWLHVSLMIAGLALLVYMTFHISNARALLFLLALPLVAIALSSNVVYTFYVLSTIYIFFITWYYVWHHITHHHGHTFLTAVAFIFLLFSNFHYIFSLSNQIFYVLGHLLELCGYLLILVNLILVKKHAQA